MPPIVIAGAIAAAGAVGGAALSSSAAGKAASTQANAAQSAAQLQFQSGQNALDFEKQQWATQQAQMQPYLQAGYGGLANLQNLLGIAPQGGYPTPGAVGPTAGLLGAQPGGGNTGGPAVPGARINVAYPGVPGGTATTPGPSGASTLLPASNLVNPQLGTFGSLSQGWNQPFVAPTAENFTADPGYQFRMQQGINALQNSAAARGTLLTGATAAGINAYGQDYGSNEYQNVYNRKLGEYQQAYNIFQQNQANQYNRLANLAGLGQVTAGQLAQGGQQFAGQAGNILLGTAGQIGQQMNNAAAATASGYAGSANAWGGALGNLSQLAQIYALQKGSGGGAGPTTAGV